MPPWSPTPMGVARCRPWTVRHRSTTASGSTTSPGAAATSLRRTESGSPPPAWPCPVDRPRRGATVGTSAVSRRASGSDSSSSSGSRSMSSITSTEPSARSTRSTPMPPSIRSVAVMPSGRMPSLGAIHTTTVRSEPSRSTSAAVAAGSAPSSTTKHLGRQPARRWGSQLVSDQTGARSPEVTTSRPSSSGPMSVTSCSTTDRAMAAVVSSAPSTTSPPVAARSTVATSAIRDRASASSRSSRRSTRRPPPGTTSASSVGRSAVPSRTVIAGGPSGPDVRSQTRGWAWSCPGATSARILAGVSPWAPCRRRCSSARSSRSCSTSARSERNSWTRSRSSARASRRASRPDATTKTTLNTMNPAESSEPVATHRATAMSSGTVADNTGKPGSRTAGGGVGRSTVIGSWGDGTAG